MSDEGFWKRIFIPVIGGSLLAGVIALATGVFDSSRTCKVYAASLGGGQRTAACNSVTDPGFYWAIAERRSVYGYSGVTASSDPQPRCGEKTRETRGQTVFVPASGATDPIEPWIVMRKYCRNKADAQGHVITSFACDLNSEDEGPQNLPDDGNSGIFFATCQKIPRFRLPQFLR